VLWRGGRNSFAWSPVSDVAVVDARTHAPARTRRLGLGGAGILSVATLASGLLAYAFLVLAARTLGPERYGQIGVLWAGMFLAVVVLFRPLEQTSARAIADRRARGEETLSVVRSVVLLLGLILLVGGAASAVGWSVITRRLFLGDDTLTIALLVGVAGYGVAYVVRGLCGGIRWFSGYGLLLSADALVRLVVALPLVLVASTGTAAAAVAAAGIGGGLAPLVFGGRRFRVLRSGAGGQPFRMRAAFTFAAPAAVIAAADQILVNAGPLLVVVDGHTEGATVGIVFAATMLVRVPVYVFQGVAASLLPNLTRLHADQDGNGFARHVRRAVGLLCAVGIAITLAAATLGPGAMQAVFGADFQAGRLELAYLGLGVAAYLAAATFTQALLALDQARTAAAAWALAAVLFLGLYFVLPGAPLLRISEAFAAAMAAGTLCLGAELALRMRRGR
jgi:O-antigen/teichoic acid export membrane protein